AFNNAHGTNWSIYNYKNLEGNFTLGDFLPWADTAPAMSAGSLGTAPEESHPGAGGVELWLNFQPTANDSINWGAAHLYWLQLAITTAPLSIVQQYKGAT